MPPNLVSKHFNKTAKEFDSIYTGEKSRFSRILDRWFRWDMDERFCRVIEECGDVEGKTIIDVGCGSGRFIEQLQMKHPKLILGVDFAPNMLAIARMILHNRMKDSPTLLVAGDFNQMYFKINFDITLAIGLFDYIADPLPTLCKMREVTSEKLIATFPIRGTLRAHIRKIRLGLRRCPVCFFTLEQAHNLLKTAGFTNIESDIFGQLIFVTAK